MFKIFRSIKISTNIENCISTANRQNIKILKNATSSFDMQQQNNPASDDEIQVISNNTKPLTKISKITGEKNSYICEIRTRSNEHFTGILLKDTKPKKISKSTQTSERDLIEHSDASTQTSDENQERTKPLEIFKRPIIPAPTAIVRPKRKRKA